MAKHKNFKKETKEEVKEEDSNLKLYKSNLQDNYEVEEY